MVNFLEKAGSHGDIPLQSAVRKDGQRHQIMHAFHRGGFPQSESGSFIEAVNAAIAVRSWAEMQRVHLAQAPTPW